MITNYEEPTYRVTVSDQTQPLGWFYSHDAAREWANEFLGRLGPVTRQCVHVTIDEIK